MLQASYQVHRIPPDRVYTVLKVCLPVLRDPRILGPLRVCFLLITSIPATAIRLWVVVVQRWVVCMRRCKTNDAQFRFTFGCTGRITTSQVAGMILV